MEDVLKLAEESLLAIRDYQGELLDKHTDRRLTVALAAIRAASAKWGWIPIAEMADEEAQPVVVGKYPKFRKMVWVTSDGWKSKKAAMMGGYTHFHRPQLPPPPVRVSKPLAEADAANAAQLETNVIP